MTTTIWIIISVGVLFATAPVTSGMRKVNEKELAKYANKQKLPIPNHLRPALIERITQRERAALTCGIAGIVISFVIGVILQTAFGGWDADMPIAGPLTLMGVAFGGGLGGLVATYRTKPLAPEQPRVARPIETTLGDYVSKGERIALWLAPVSIALSTAAMWIIAARTPGVIAEYSNQFVMLTVVAGFLLLLWGAMLFACTHILNRPQHAGDDLELAWDDAERTVALRGLIDNAIAMAMVSSLVTLVGVANVIISPQVREGAQGLTAGLGGLAFITGLVCWAIVLIPYLTGRFNPTPWRKLWAGKDLGVDSDAATSGDAAHTDAAGTHAGANTANTANPNTATTSDENA